MSSKACRQCETKKPLSDFYKHTRMLDGHLNKCKECVKKRVKKHRDENIERIREYDKSRRKVRNEQYFTEYYTKYPNKYKAHYTLNNAIKRGDVLRGACEVCGSENADAHHDDYLLPLSVRWLCKIHHNLWHKENGQGKNPN